MKQKLWISGRLPGLNEIIAENRKSPLVGAKQKKIVGANIRWVIRGTKLNPMTSCKMVFIWIEPNNRRDKDNISSGGRKFILDALVEERVIPNDGWKEVICWEDHFYTSKDPKKVGVMVLFDDLSGSIRLPDQYTDETMEEFENEE